MNKQIFILCILFSFSLFSIPCFSLCDPEAECDRDFFNTCCRIIADGEFLYWTADVNAVDYAIKQQEANDSDCGIGDFILADYDYEPAFRIGLRYYNAPKYWEAYAQYTRFTNSSRNTTEDNAVFLKPTFEDGLQGISVFKADSKIKLCYQLLDFMATRVFDPNPHLRMRFIAGLTGAWIRQTWKVHYSAVDGNTSRLKNKWTYRAIGYRTGVTADWFWFCNMYLTGKASAALAYGKYENIGKLQSTAEPNPTQSIRDLHYEDYRVATHIQLLVGPSYQTISPCWDLEIFAGYEFNAWTNLHEIFRCGSNGDLSKSLVNNGTLGIHGLVVRITLAY